MAASVGSSFFKGETGRNTRGLLRLIILVTIAATAVASRLFSVIRFESIIHECTPILSTLPRQSLTTIFYSRSLVQLPRNKVPGAEWLLELLGLVRRPHMAPPRPCYWWYPLPWSHGHQRCHLPLPPPSYLPCRHPQHLCHAGSRLLWPDCLCQLPPDL